MPAIGKTPLRPVPATPSAPSSGGPERAPDPKQLKVDVRGPDGHRASDGVDGSNGHWGGGDGQDGGDAGRAGEGGRGGNIHLDLSVSEFEDGTAVQAKVAGNTAFGGELRDEQVLPQGSTVHLDARGGDGGHGGTGGDGGDGARGSDGRDATRYSSGTNGEDGGDGGDGGRGSSGADGGDGGDIRIRVPAGDLDALAAVRSTRVDGGDGGAPGRHGSGGRGGSGGSGGSSYSWTEKDNQGNTDYKSNPGGFSGSHGRSGSSPSGGLSSGRTGRDGTSVIDVVHPDGRVEQYADRYRVTVQGDAITDSNADGVYEPGEKLALDVTLANTGPMTTPDKTLTERVVSNPHVQAGEASEAELPKSMAPGKGTTVKGLGVVLTPDTSTHVGEPLNVAATIDTVARAVRPGVDLPESAHGTPLTIRFPVEISAVDGDRTATLERPAAVSWKVTNVSTKALGSDSDCRRIVDSFLKKTGGDVAGEYLTFTGADGKEVPLTEGIGQVIANLPPGKSVELKGTIKFSPEAPAYSNVKLTALLDMGALDAPEKSRPVQAREFSVQLARNYAKDPQAGVLMVVNNRSTKEEIKAWEDLAKELGTKANVWNLSLYGAVSLTQAVKDVELGQDFAGKTMVILNNQFDPEEGVSSPLGHLADKELLIAACKGQMSTYVVGGELDINARLTPGEGMAVAYADRGQHKDAVKDHQAGTDRELGHDHVEISVRGRPSEEKLAKQARKVLETVEGENPDRRYYLEQRYQPAPEDDSLFAFLKKHEAGTVRVARGADVSRHAVMQTRPGDVHSTEFVASPANRYALCKALTLPQKLAALDLAAAEDPESPTAQALTKALLSDLAEEQQALRQQTWSGAVSRDEIAAKLWRMSAVAEHFEKVDYESVLGGFVTELAAQVGHMTEQARTFGDHVLPFRRRTSADHVSDELIGAMLEKAFAHTPADLKTAKFEVKLRREELEKQDAEKPKEERLSMAAYLRPEKFWSPETTSDFDVWAKQHEQKD